VYVLGGFDGSNKLNDVQYAKINADGTVGAWNSTTSFRTERGGHTSVVYNGYLYVIGGGTDFPNFFNDVQYAKINANGTIGSWNTTTQFTTARFGHTSVVHNGYVYVIGGHDGSNYLNDVQYAKINANGTVGTWNSTTPFTTGRAGHTSVVHNGYVYVIGGVDVSNYLNDVQYAKINADGTVGPWNSTTSFVTERSSHTSVVHNGYVYVLGGEAVSSYFNDVQYTSFLE
jgi:N-acetylneuraminic acid mutarotase